MSSPVVITGLGVVSPIGSGLDEFWEALIAGRVGVGIREAFADSDLPFRLAAEIKDFDGTKYVKPRKALKVMCRPVQFGYASAIMAAEMAGLNTNDFNPDRKGIVFGTETFHADPLEVARVFRKCIDNQGYHHDRWGEYAMREIQPLWMLKYLPNMVASHISIGLDCRGPSNSICQGAASGLLAIIESVNLIQRGAADVVIAGATGSRMSLISMLSRGADLFSHQIHNPEIASRPFDLNRDGDVAGEGAAAIVLESQEHAERRGATPLARIAGWSQTHCKIDHPDFSKTIEHSLNTALNQSRLNPHDIGFINTTGNSTPQEDIDEAKAINQVFGDQLVSANKGNFGHLGPGSSAVEFVATVKSLMEKQVPPNPTFSTPDPNCPVNINRNSAAFENESALKISFSSTGQIGSVIVSSN